MKVTDILSESKAAEKAKQANIKRSIKKFNSFIDKAGAKSEKADEYETEFKKLSQQFAELKELKSKGKKKLTLAMKKRQESLIKELEKIGGKDGIRGARAQGSRYKIYADKLRGEAEKLNNEANIIAKDFEKSQGMSIPDYETKLNIASRNVNSMLERIKTADLKAGSSTNLISKEAGAGALLIHILRDVAGQLDDDASNMLTSFLSSNAKTNPPTKNQVAVAKAVADRVKELGLHKEYAGKTVSKQEKHGRTYDYDKENTSEYQDEY